MNSFVKHPHVHLHFKNLDHSNLGPKTFQRIAFNGILEERTRKKRVHLAISSRNFRSNILFPTRDRIFPYRDSAHRNLPIEIFVLSRSSVARQDFSIIARDKCRKVCVSEIKFLDSWSESVTTIQFRPRKKTRIAEKCTFRRKSFSRETRDNLRRLTIGKEMFGLRSEEFH